MMPEGLAPPLLDGSAPVSRQATDWLAARIIAGDVGPGARLSGAASAPWSE